MGRDDSLKLSLCPGGTANKMTRRRFFASPAAFNSNSHTVTLASDEGRHLRDVLRLAPGAEVFVFDGEGKEYRCAVEHAERSATSLQVVEEVEPASLESPLRLTLCVALLKGEKFDLVVQKTTELGVTRLVPVMTARADVRLRDVGDAKKRVARWQRIAKESARQSGRALVPQITTPTDFGSVLAGEQLPGILRLMFSERGGAPLTPELGGRSERQSQPTVMFALVGSEGGWTDEELAAAPAAGWQVVTLGGRTLRAETAAITVVALLQHLFGDLK